MISRRFAFLAAILWCFASASIGRAQDASVTSSGSQSLGDAGRKARAQKKDSSKAAKVFTNEDMGGLKGTISVIGNEPAPASATASAGPTPGASLAGAPAGPACGCCVCIR